MKLADLWRQMKAEILEAPHPDAKLAQQYEDTAKQFEKCAQDNQNLAALFSATPMNSPPVDSSKN